MGVIPDIFVLLTCKLEIRNTDTKRLCLVYRLVFLEDAGFHCLVSLVVMRLELAWNLLEDHLCS